MTKFLKVSLIIFLSFLVVALSLTAAFFIITKDAKLDESKLIKPNQNVIIYDDNGNEITSASVSGKNKSVEIENHDSAYYKRVYCQRGQSLLLTQRT